MVAAQRRARSEMGSTLTCLIMPQGSGRISTDAEQRLPGSTSPKDVARGVDVGVGTVPTRKTKKHRLVDSVASFNVAALATGLTGVVGIHRHYDPTGTFSLVGE